MPKHTPIKFEDTLEPSLRKWVKQLVAKDSKAKSVINATLAIAALGGIITFGAIFAPVLGTFLRFQKRQKQASYEEYRKIWRNFYRLKQQRTFQFVCERDGYIVYRLTEKGKEKIKKLIFDELIMPLPVKWDEKWRLVIFDIPEKYRAARTSFRKKLSELGFYQCQKSVWIHPFPCLEEIEFLKDFFKIKPFVKIFIVDEMTDGKVLYHFKDILKTVITHST